MKFAMTVLMFGLALTSVSAVSQQSAWAQSSEVKGTLNLIQKRIDSLEKRYIKPALFKTEFSAEKRFNDAKVAYVLKQYGKSNLLFLDVITRTKPNEFIGYRESLYLLGDGLYKNRNHVGARTFLNELVALGAGPYYQKSLGTLLEIAFYTNDYRGVKAVYQKLDSQQNLSAAVSYLRGKTRFSQNDYAGARKDFAAAAKDERFYHIATYYGAVVDVVEKKYPSAILKYTELLKKKPATPKQLEVFHLSNLAMGRLLYEQGKYDESLVYYNRLPRTHPKFMIAVYEASWALVQMKKYKTAKESIEVLIFDDPDPKLYTRAMLLRADLSLRVKDYKTALSAFEDVLKRYDPVKIQMEEFASKHSDLKTFFLSLVDDNLVIATPKGLPLLKTQFKVETPEQWLNRGKLVERATLMGKDVLVSKQEIAQSYKMLDEVDARLNSNTRIKSFPDIAEGMGVAIALEADLLEARRDILDREYKLLKGSLNSDEMQIWQKMSTELAALEIGYKKVPRTIQALDAREQKIKKDFEALKTRLGKMSYSINKLKAEAKAIDIYMQTQTLMLSVEARKKVDNERALLNQDIKKLEDQQQAMRKELDIARQEVGYGSILSPNEYSVRDAYRKKLAAMSDFLAPMKGRTSASELGQLASQRNRISPMEARLLGYRKNLYTSVDKRVVELKQQVVNERVVLKSLDASLSTIGATTKDAVANIAHQNFLNKKTEFDRIVLRADVGKIDVLYQGKEDATKEINKLFQQRTNELKALQESFEDVR